MNTQALELFGWHSFDSSLASCDNPRTLFKEALTATKEQLRQLFEHSTSVSQLVYSHVYFMDELLKRAWSLEFRIDQPNMALIAVGGYGRGELHPASDIDLLILTADEVGNIRESQLEIFITFLWDIGLEVGQSVRTVDECVTQAIGDITIATNIMESRLLCGSADLYVKLDEKTAADKIWPSNQFFEAKLKEQQARHQRFGDTAYNLEPNIKENPGGLRDIQVIGWVAKRHFGVDTLHALVEKTFLTKREYETLIEGQLFLWQIRYGLHTLSGRREDRLLFDFQRTLATQFGFSDSKNRLAVERFMKKYYRTVLELNRLNEMLLQLFDEVILSNKKSKQPITINKRFQIRNGFIEVSRNDVFRKYPFALLEIFLVSAQRPELKGFRAETIRLIRDHRHLIDEAFRQDVRCTSLFMEIFRQPAGLTHELRRMNRYGVLASYLPIFGNIVGQMQHDLFHVYTVDEHTMFVVRNLRRFTVKEFAHEFPLCSEIIQTIPKPELLYIAGFFHDMAKGRGGDHSILGAEDASVFCKQHGLSQYDSNVVSWLITQHLTMSTTAQRKDISDSNVINQFARIVGTQQRLKYLYLLTVADIRATNPALWNSWKDSLLAELYYSTVRALRYDTNGANLDKELIEQTKTLCTEKLNTLGFTTTKIQQYWHGLFDEYFVRYSVDEIVWHSQSILRSNQQELPLILVREQTHRGGTELFVYTQAIKFSFALITATLDNLGLTVTDARITNSKNGFTLDTFIVLDKEGEVIKDQNRIHEIRSKLKQNLVEFDIARIRNNNARQSLTRLQKHFPIAPKVTFGLDEANQRTIVEVIAQDQPGLLAKIAMAMVDCDIKLQNAKIATFGEKAEDIFFVTDSNGDPILNQSIQNNLKNNILEALS